MGNLGQVLVASDLSPRADLAVSRAWRIASSTKRRSPPSMWSSPSADRACRGPPGNVWPDRPRRRRKRCAGKRRQRCVGSWTTAIAGAGVRRGPDPGRTSAFGDRRRDPRAIRRPGRARRTWPQFSARFALGHHGGERDSQRRLSRPGRQEKAGASLQPDSGGSGFPRHLAKGAGVRAPCRTRSEIASHDAYEIWYEGRLRAGGTTTEQLLGRTSNTRACSAGDCAASLARQGSILSP